MAVSSRSCKAFGDAIRRFRLNLGWTQEELANKSGYSVRLIRKAESSGRLDIESIQNIAESLTHESQTVRPQDITIDLRSIAIEWMNILNESPQELGKRTAHHLTDDFTFHCPGAPNTAPFIGDWHGVDGLSQFWQAYLGVFRREPHQDVVYAVSDDLVIARFMENAYIGDQLCGPIRIHMVFHFRNSKIYRIDDDYDTHAGVLAKTKAEEFLEERKGLAIKFLKIYEEQEVNEVIRLANHLTPEFELHCLANADGLPFAGAFHGLDGAKNFLERFFGALQRSGSVEADFLVLDNRVVANFQDLFSVGFQKLEPVQVSVHFHFTHKLISRIEFQIDHQGLKYQLSNEELPS